MSDLLQRHSLLKEATELLLTETQTFDGLASDILTDVVIQTIHTYQEKLNVGVQDSVADLLETFKHKVAQTIFETARGWRVVNTDPFLLPRGCRYAFTKGDSTVFVIEQDPLVRSLAFPTSMLIEEHGVPGDDRTERVALALPYSIFVVHFKKSRDTNVYCGWRTAPLRSLDDVLAIPLLPNIHDNMQVCMGRDMRLVGTSMAEQCDSLLSNFWNSRFNNDLSTNWWNKHRIDRRLRTGRMWAENSEEDPLFILSVSFPQNEERSLRRTINVLTQHEEEPDENGMRHRLAEAIESSSEALFAKILRYFKKTKFDKYHPKNIKEALGQAMKTASAEVADILLAVQHELETLSAQITERRHTTRPERRGPMWSDYCP